jgi:hypothetical protein
VPFADVLLLVEEVGRLLAVTKLRPLLNQQLHDLRMLVEERKVGLDRV